jgi:hypothetical protein
MYGMVLLCLAHGAEFSRLRVPAVLVHSRHVGASGVGAPVRQVSWPSCGGAHAVGWCASSLGFKRPHSSGLGASSHRVHLGLKFGPS